MKPQLPHSRRQTGVDLDIDALTLDELRAYNAGQRERLTTLIVTHCGCGHCGRCDQCSHRPLCGRRSQGH